MNNKLGREPRGGSGTPFEVVALVLQGGGALGSYQAGVYEQMDAHGLRPSWVAGVSIGAVNAAIIAGVIGNVRSTNRSEG